MGLTGFNRVRRMASLNAASPLSEKKEETVAEPVVTPEPKEEVKVEEPKPFKVGKKKGVQDGNNN